MRLRKTPGHRSLLYAIPTDQVAFSLPDSPTLEGSVIEIAPVPMDTMVSLEAKFRHNIWTEHFLGLGLALENTF